MCVLTEAIWIVRAALEGLPNPVCKSARKLAIDTGGTLDEWVTFLGVECNKTDVPEAMRILVEAKVMKMVVDDTNGHKRYSAALDFKNMNAVLCMIDKDYRRGMTQWVENLSERVARLF